MIKNLTALFIVMLAVVLVLLYLSDRPGIAQALSQLSGGSGSGDFTEAIPTPVYTGPGEQHFLDYYFNVADIELEQRDGQLYLKSADGGNLLITPDAKAPTASQDWDLTVSGKLTPPNDCKFIVVSIYYRGEDHVFDPKFDVYSIFCTAKAFVSDDGARLDPYSEQTPI